MNHDWMHAIERVAGLVPGVPRLTILDTLEDELERLLPGAGSDLVPFVVSTTVRRLAPDGDAA